MKKNQLFQFSLTVICSMVLAACGSSGGSSNPSTQATNTTPAANPAPTTPAAPKTEIANAASDNQDKQKLTTEVSGTPFIGYKHVSKRDSGFIINETAGGNNGADTPEGMNLTNPNRSFDTLVVAEPVRQEEGKPAKVGYLEDFDFRKDQVEYKVGVAADMNTASTGGVHTLKNDGEDNNGIFVNEKTVYDTTVALPNSGNNSRKPDSNDTSKEGLNNTKTETRGGHADHTVLVYDGVGEARFNAYTHSGTDVQKLADNKANHNTVTGAGGTITNVDLSDLYQNYTDTHFSPATMAKIKHKADGTIDYDNKGLVTISNATNYKSRSEMNRNGAYQNENDQKQKSGTTVSGSKNVGEVYGYRTFAYGGQYQGPVNDTDAKNLPLENKRLSKVQYGRVTAALADNHSFADFKKGALQNSAIESYVVDYGTYGTPGTEDHYFYRGVDGIKEAELKKLQDKGATLEYWGHAVSYGLNNRHDGAEVSVAAPTAIGAGGNARFVSGNHVHAVVNMGTGNVNGSIYNTWVVPTADNPNKGNLKPVDLVQFEGKLASNGNIAGTSHLTYGDKATGVFGANLYGAQAQEMGGIVASHDKTEKGKWGAVFGAIAGSSSEIQNATNRGL